MNRPAKTLACAILAIAGAALSVPASAKGCLAGAAVGGVAGHVAGGHGLIGAGAGCLVGRHRAAKKARAAQTAPAVQNTRAAASR